MISNGFDSLLLEVPEISCVLHIIDAEMRVEPGHLVVDKLLRDKALLLDIGGDVEHLLLFSRKDVHLVALHCRVCSLDEFVVHLSEFLVHVILASDP